MRVSSTLMTMLWWAMNAFLTLVAGEWLCNGHQELCARKYSNVTSVAAHNSPFAEIGNPWSNQFQDVTMQLDHGVRMLQLQTHLNDGVIHMCHTSCTMLDAGPLENFFTTVAQWLETHRTDVVTILIGNGDGLPPTDFATPLIDSGLNQFVYTPPAASMTVDAWPTLANMIDVNTTCVVMLDYGADFASAPWLIGEFDGVMWETPFSPTDPDFPCIAQRPPDKPRDDRLNQLIMMNHNLNTNWSVGGNEILVPNLVDIDETNADHGKSSVGAAMDLCTESWGRPPNFLLVDFYERGNFELSVLSVAARANNVSWNPAQVNEAASGWVAASKSAFAFSVLVAATLVFSAAAVQF